MSESTSQETFEGTSQTDGSADGVLGPDGESTAGEGTGNNYSSSSSDRVFGNDRTTEVVEQAPGDVQHLSIAVLVDEARGHDIRAIEQLVQTSAGLDPALTTIEVSQLPFDTSLAEANQAALADAKAAQARKDLFSLLRTVASILIVAIVLFLAWRSHKKAAVARFPVAIPLPTADPDDRGLPAGSATASTDIDGELEALLAGGVPALTDEDVEREAVQGQIAELIDRQPDDVAQVLRTWMAER